VQRTLRRKKLQSKKQVVKQNEREKLEKQKEEGQTPMKKEKHTTEEEVVWWSDTSDGAARARRERMLPDAVNKIVKKSLDIAEVKENLQSSNKLVELKDQNGLSNGDLVSAVFDCITTPQDTNLSSIVKHKEALKNFVEETDGQVALLHCIEKFCGETQPSLLPKVAPIIKEIYDEELVDEQVIIAWFGEETTLQKVKDSVAPLIKWLKETEEESDSEED